LRSSARVVTSLEREQALDELRQAGTLAVMPSLLDNSPNTVAECVECGIPFIASATGGIPELVAEGDRERVLFGPTADDLAATLERVLTSSSFAPARPARSAPGALDSWLELVDTVRPSSAPAVRPVTQVAVVAAGEASEQHARRLAERTHTVDVEVVRDASRRSGSRERRPRGSSSWTTTTSRSTTCSTSSWRHRRRRARTSSPRPSIPRTTPARCTCSSATPARSGSRRTSTACSGSFGQSWP
jgi:hypothetical protein